MTYADINKTGFIANTLPYKWSVWEGDKEEGSGLAHLVLFGDGGTMHIDGSELEGLANVLNDFIGMIKIANPALLNKETPWE